MRNACNLLLKSSLTNILFLHNIIIYIIAGNEPYTKLYQLVSCGNDHNVKLWEVTVSQNKCETQPSTAIIQLCRVMEKHSSALTCVRFSSNGLYIASTGLDKTAVIWETVRLL